METELSKQLKYIRRVVDYRKRLFSDLAGPDQLWQEASTKDIKKIVVIAAASRSGSSLLFSLLKKMPGVYSLSGESVPFYKINGFSSDAFSSDEIPGEVSSDKNKLSGFSRDFLSDFSLAAQASPIIEEENTRKRYIHDLALRFSLQWPEIDFSPGIFKRLASEAYILYLKGHQVFRVEEFYLELILSLRRQYPKINPYYYDLPSQMIKKKFPALKIPSGPSGSVLTIEEPPFILLAPCLKPKKEDLLDKTLLLKSSADCYRLPFLKTVFPNAEIKVIYLTRNPLGSINGLYDGWLYRGFFSHNLKGSLKNSSDCLKIPGYSDRYSWGKYWWKYDLPADWRSYAHKRLEEVCSFQWYSANAAVRQYLDKTKIEYCPVKYEHIIGSAAARAREVIKIINFIGLNAAVFKDLDLDRLPVVQATKPPKTYRWKKRERMLLPFLADSQIAAMSESLGYRKDKLKEWF